MELTVLGASGAWPAPGGAANGYLVVHDGFSLVLDFGVGSMSNLQRHVRHEDVGAVAVSHEHVDHCLDVYTLFLARHFHPEPLPPLPLISPPGVLDRLAVLEDEEGVRDLRASFDLREVSPGDPFDIGPFRVQTALLPHSVPNMGTRITADGVVLAYTGDTAPSEEIVALARDADLLIAEASWVDGQEVGRPANHLTARQAAEHASRAGARRLMLSHLWPTNDRAVSLAQAAEAFPRSLILAEEGLRLEVGESSGGFTHSGTEAT